MTFFSWYNAFNKKIVWCGKFYQVIFVVLVSFGVCDNKVITNHLYWGINSKSDKNVITKVSVFLLIHSLNHLYDDLDSDVLYFWSIISLSTGPFSSHNLIKRACHLCSKSSLRYIWCLWSLFIFQSVDRYCLFFPIFLLNTFCNIWDMCFN
mgnify:FL=1